jgi:hypothetical protein
MLFISEDLKKVYLIFYNLCQFVGFTYIFTVMAVRYFRDGPSKYILNLSLIVLFTGSSYRR